ncbi:MAG: hypothetical protein KA175_17190 [Flavobacteriales bacterium]|nr:hypothetical protein [Flavobacteriales bacterium]
MLAVPNPLNVTLNDHPNSALLHVLFRSIDSLYLLELFSSANIGNWSILSPP